MCRPGVFLQNQYLIIYYKMWIPKLVDSYNDDMCPYLKAFYCDTSFFLKEKMVIMTIHLPLSLHFGRAGCYYPFIYFFEAIILSFLNSLRALNFGFPLFVFFFYKPFICKLKHLFLMCISNVGDQMSSPTVSFVIKNIDTKTSSLDIYIKGRAIVWRP